MTKAKYPTVEYEQALADLYAREEVLGGLISMHKLIWQDDVKTAGTDGTRLIISPKWWSSISRNQRTIVLGHEATHVAFGHHLRRGSRNFKAWNKACDRAVNPMFAMWPGFHSFDGLMPAQIGMPNGLEAEAYYRVEDEEPDKGKGKGAPSDKTEPGIGAGDPSDMGGVLDPEVDAQKAEQEWVQAVTSVTMGAQGIGTIGNGLRQRMSAALAVKPLTWQQLLRRWFLHKAKVRRSWERPNRRQAVISSADLLLPSLSGRRMGRLVMLVDTSGSMHVDWLRDAIQQISQLMRVLKFSDLVVIEFTTVVNGVHRFRPGQKIDPSGWSWRCTGGTVIRGAMIKAVEERPDLIVVWTDGELTLPPKPQRPVLWLLTKRVPKKAWGASVYVEDARAKK